VLAVKCTQYKIKIKNKLFSFQVEETGDSVDHYQKWLHVWECVKKSLTDSLTIAFLISKIRVHFNFIYDLFCISKFNYSYFFNRIIYILYMQ